MYKGIRVDCICQEKSNIKDIKKTTPDGEFKQWDIVDYFGKCYYFDGYDKHTNTVFLTIDKLSFKGKEAIWGDIKKPTKEYNFYLGSPIYKDELQELFKKRK